MGICVAAGPSLVKNVDLLRDPAYRARVVVIAVQTALEPLLDRGIEPDFVTAIDYSRICKRFYEALPPLPRTTLVIDPKAHPVIFDAYPGPVRMVGNDFNDELLGELRRPVNRVKAAATVAHLSLYLAEFLGCDPIAFIGQDLGFSNGLYYAPGTAVHRVWSSEINRFNTMEMMEWTRVVRMRGHLRRAEDIDGQPCFTDEQMATYLKQFERDFADAERRGVTILDCTEGGLPKEHTARQTLREALDDHAPASTPPLQLPGVPEPGVAAWDAERVERLQAVLRARTAEVQTLRKLTRDTRSLVEKMTRHQRDSTKMARLFKRLKANQHRVQTELKTTFSLVNQINCIGAFRRHKADRAIQLAGAEVFERQRAQMDRDAENLDLLVEACDETLDLLREASERLAEQASSIDAIYINKQPRPGPVAAGRDRAPPCWKEAA